MKKVAMLFSFFFLLLSCQKQIDSINDRLDKVEDRLEKLEELCKTLNSNVSGLQGLVSSLETNNFIKDIKPLTEDGETIGYTITFTKGDPINIYNGADGYTPKIGVQQDTDGIYYWTLDGKWILGASENKIPATGNTPMFKVEDECWLVSYDNGETWTNLGSARGEKGDSFFKEIKTDGKYVHFTLADGTVLTVPKVSQVIDNLKSISYIPRYSDGKAVMINTPNKQFSFVELDIAVSPKDLVGTLTVDLLKVNAINTITRSVSFIDLPVLSFTADAANGTITVKASGKNLPDSFFAGEEEMKIAAHVTDGNYDFVTDYIQMVSPKRVQHPYDGAMKVVAHRGYHKAEGSAENSIAALRKADEIKVWGCEVDIWETNDSVLVVNHDPAINNVSIQDNPYSAIKDFTLANGETLPTFENYLKVFKEECRNVVLVVEIKTHGSEAKTISATKAAVSMIRKMGLQDRVEYISFSAVAGDAVVKYDPTARFAMLDEGMTPVQCAERGYTGVDYHHSIINKNPSWVTDSKAYGLEVNTWTVNDEACAKMVRTRGATMLTTDYPENVKMWYAQSNNQGNVSGEDSKVEYE